MNILEELKPRLLRLNTINSCGAKDEAEHTEYLCLERHVKEQLAPHGYTINWNHIFQEFGIALVH